MKNKKTKRPIKKSKILSLAGTLHKEYLKNPLDIDKIRDKIDYS